jgi:hypothetical protein
VDFGFIFWGISGVDFFFERARGFKVVVVEEMGAVCARCCNGETSWRGA